MISAVAAAAAAERSGSSENLNTLGVLQEINLLRESQLLIDIHVEASHGRIFGAHKVILAAQFKRLRSLLTQPSEVNRNTLSLTRYSGNVVAAALIYAYTGKIELKLGRAERMFLLAHNLQCGRLMKTCRTFLIQSLSTENVGRIWGIAQSTNNKKLITACLPLLASNIPRIVEMKLTLDEMKELLQLPSVRCIGGERQLRLVANWMDGEHSSTDTVDPVGQLNSLLHVMDLKSVTENAFFDFMSENHIIMSNQACRQRLAAAMKEARCATLESDLLIAEITSLGAKEATLRSVVEFHPAGSLRMSIPYRPGCTYSVAKGKLYVTGGRINGGEITNQAEELDVSSQTGEIKALPPMVEPRRRHTLAAAGPFVFAFGGFNGPDKTSSCEFFDSRTNKWALLPSLSEAKYAQSSLVICDGDNEVAVLVVGGFGGTGKEAGLLSGHSNQAGSDEEIQWKWQQLSQMNESRRNCPGMLLLGRDRVFVAGGGTRLAEILHLSLNDNDRGIWTLLTQPLTQAFRETFLVNCNNRILAIGHCKQCEELVSPSTSPLLDAPVNSFVWRPLPNIQAADNIVALFKT